MANTATSVCPSVLSGWVLATHASTLESKFSASISQKADLRGWNRRESCTALKG